MAEVKISRRHTQWAAQFAVASELSRRGYDIAFTMGNNTPDADLLVASPGGKIFSIDVKGMQRPNFWLIKEKVPCRTNLYYVLVYLPPDGTNKYFVMTHKQVLNEIRQWKKHAPSGWETSKFPVPGFNWKRAHDYENHWDVLPS